MNVSIKKAAKLIAEEKCEEIIDNITTIAPNKTILKKELVENCEPFAASSILFLSVSVILTGLFIYFYVNSRSKNNLPY